MKSIITMLLIITGLFLLSYCTSQDRKPETTEEAQGMSAQEIRDKGEYLVTIGGCHDCHSPKAMGERGPIIIQETALSGYPTGRSIMNADKDALKQGWVLINEDITQAAGPWGMSFSANITSDESGIGNWTEEQFRKALTQGKYKGLDGTRMLLPPMPWQNYVNMTEEDLFAIFTYLKSTNPVGNVVPAPIPPNEL
jgi:hypothetical protein